MDPKHDPNKNPAPTNPEVQKTAPKKPVAKANPQTGASADAGSKPSPKAAPQGVPAGAKPLPKAQAQAGPRPQPGVSIQPAGQLQRPGNRPVAQGAAAQGQRQGDEETEEALEGGGFGAWLKQAPSWLTSMVVHVAVLIVLAVMTLPLEELVTAQLVMEEEQVVEQEDIIELPEKPPIEQPKELNLNPTSMVEAPTALTQNENPENPEIDKSMEAPLDFNPALISDEKRFRDEMFKGFSNLPGTAVSGRSNQAERGRLLKEGGGTPESEAAVAAALKWLAEHQLPDGSWSFDHREGLCQGRCKNHGSLKDARMGSTGLALLPFLGAGNTHLTGKYKKNVHAGLYYLIQHIGQDGAMNDSGTMYSHGLASIALCEAYAMTNDKATLGRAALASVNFITHAQDPVGGGWRYSPRTPGDTSVVGWQAMALLSAKMAYLHVDPKTFTGLNNFLNSVQVESGAKYGYTQPGVGPATTAIGLLCRMYLGWKRDNGALVNGVAYLSEMGPSANNMYYNYYATQVIHHYGGEEWKKWNEKMREQLINTQDQDGHQEGSWHFGGGHGSDQGGRHYNTCMCAMTLEVYYRHLPIYKKQATEEEFEF